MQKYRTITKMQRRLSTSTAKADLAWDRAYDEAIKSGCDEKQAVILANTASRAVCGNAPQVTSIPRVASEVCGRGQGTEACASFLGSVPITDEEADALWKDIA